MRRVTATTMTLLALWAASTSAGVIVVDPGGGGDYDNIPEAEFHAGSGDTVLVLPGTYEVTDAPSFHSWPIPLHADSPTFLSQSGAESTVIEGDGTMAPFRIEAGVGNSMMHVHGFTFRLLEQIIDRHESATTAASMRFTDNVVDTGPGVWADLDVIGTPGVLIARNVFTGSRTTGVNISGGSSGWLEDNDIAGYSYGVVSSSGGIEMLGNHIYGCVVAGVSVPTGEHGEATMAMGNLVEDNGTGFLLGHTGVLSGNIVRHNDVGIEWHHVLPYGTGVTLTGNDIYGNDTNVVAPQGDYDISAMSNWWGTTDPVEIADGISDCNDPPGGTCCIVFFPWCTEPIPGCEAVGIIETTSWGVVKSLYMR